MPAPDELARGAPASVSAHPEAAARPPIPRVVVGARACMALGAIVLFFYALQVLQAGARGISPDAWQAGIANPANALGFGWLTSMVALSGSPVAALSVTLRSTGSLSDGESFAMLAGSRMGASFIVLAVGYLSWRGGRRSPDGLAVGTIALLTTVAVQIPALLVGLVAIRAGWHEALAVPLPSSIGDGLSTLSRPVVQAAGDLLPPVGLFILGAGGLLGSLTLFDRALPESGESVERVAGLFARVNGPWLPLAAGALITLGTLSVSLSVTLLVPLALRGYVQRSHVAPYVMGANVTTFADTAVAAMLVGGQAAVAIVLLEVLAATAVSCVALLVAWRWFETAILGIAGWSTHSSRNLVYFLTVLFIVPIALVLAA